MTRSNPRERSIGVGRAKLSDVARMAGVSVATASRALARPEMVSPDTRETVQRAAKAIGYHPNLIARSLRTQSSHTVFVLLPDFESPFYPGIISGLDWAAHERGYSLMLGLAGNEAKRQSSYVEIVHRQRADGIIVLDCELTHLLKSDGPFGIPAVQVLEKVEPCDFPSITVDDRLGAALATRHLVELGHRRIGHIAGKVESTVTPNRIEGYRDALAAAGIEFDPGLVVYGTFRFAGGAAAVERLMALPGPPTAIFCGNDESAFGAITRLNQLGFRVPGDISIVGFDDIDKCATNDPPLTTVRQPRFDIGVRAMTTLIGMIEGKQPAAPDVRLPVELVVRQSTARCQPVNWNRMRQDS